MNTPRWVWIGISTFLTSAAALADGPFYPLPARAPVPKNNPMTQEKVELGKQLFFDPRISLDGSVSCNSCHNVMAGGSDGRALSVGVGGKTGTRSAPTVWNSAFLSVQFWDGREPDLEGQAKGPMINPVEMAMGANHDLVIKRIKSVPGYREEFKKVFGDQGISIDTVTKAIAAYERTLITPNSPYDKYLRGQKGAISKEAERGGERVKQAGCIACHRGVNYAGPDLKIGEGFYQKFPTLTDNEYVKKYHLDEDLGRYQVTGKEEDKHMWRVPTWRNIALTAPYFHNGSVATLEEAVRVMGKTQLNKTFSDAEVRDIVAFLNSLTGEFPVQTMPRLPETTGTSSLIR